MNPVLVAKCDICGAESEGMGLIAQTSTPIFASSQPSVLWDDKPAKNHLSQEGWRTIVGNELMCPECARQFELWRKVRQFKVEDKECSDE